MKKILKKKWEFYIARNIPIWHDELTLLYSLKGYSQFKIFTTCFEFRVHRSVQSDFYWLSRGRYGREQFARQMAVKWRDKNFIGFMKNEYAKKCRRLVTMSKQVSSTVISLENFFDFYGRCLCMLDLTSFSSKLLTKKVLDLLKNFSDREEIIAYYSCPKKLAPIQKLERELAVFHGRKVNVRRESEKLYKKYCWIPVSFVGEPWGVDYFEERIRSYEPEKKHILIKPKTKLSLRARYYLRMLSEVSYLNEFRKAAFSQANYHIRPLFDKIAKNHGLPGWRSLSLLCHNEIIDLVRGKDKYQKKLLVKRKLCALYNETVDKVEFVYGDYVLEFEKKFKPKADNAAEVKGVVANKGKIIGKVKIISGPIDFSKFESGDILVAKMTSVDFIPIMKGASAFITDEGGLACHAAIVAREYNKPCIIGTGIATSAFKDGDLVEVDAEKGVVRKIK